MRSALNLEGQEALDLLLRTYTAEIEGQAFLTVVRNQRNQATQPIRRAHGFLYEDHLRLGKLGLTCIVAYVFCQSSPYALVCGGARVISDSTQWIADSQELHDAYLSAPRGIKTASGYH